MTLHDYDSLEQERFALGRRELSLEETLQTLRQNARQYGLAGKHDVADQAWSLFERYRHELTELQTHIRKLEAKVYSSRRRSQS